MDRIRLPTIDATRPLGAAAYGTLQPLTTPSMPTVPGMGARGFTSPALDRGGYKNAADRFLSKYSQDFATGYEDDFGIGFGDEGVGSPFTNVGAIAGGALANAQGAINAAASRHGIPANLLAAIIARESTGNWDRDGNRYVYLPERGYNILPYVGMTDPAVKRVGMDPRSLVGNMEGQIEAAARLIKAISQEEAAGYGWQGVANVYYSGDPTGRTTPSDSWQHGSTQQYGNDILRFWEMLEPGGPSKASTSSRSGSSAFGSLEAVFGGSSKPLTQDFGLTDFAKGAGAWMYGYSSSLGVQGHAGLDYGMVPGESLYAPVGGTVIIAGGSGYYTDERYGNQPGTGELRIKLDNGDEVILGHMQRINVQVGQRVQPGQFVGQSGTLNGGHVHVEVRKYTPGATSSGYTAVDPRSYFGGGSFSSAGGGAMGMVQNAAQKALSDFKRQQTFNRAGQSVGSQVGSMFSSLFGW